MCWSVDRDGPIPLNGVFYADKKNYLELCIVVVQNTRGLFTRELTQWHGDVRHRICYVFLLFFFVWVRELVVH